MASRLAAAAKAVIPIHIAAPLIFIARLRSNLSSMLRLVNG
jgi:hypothetical protein